MQAVAAVESMSQHPLARAIVDYAVEQGTGKAEIRNFQSVTGKGAFGEVDGTVVHVGSMKWASELTELPVEMKKRAEELQLAGKSVMAVLFNETFQALIAVTDPLRAESIDVLASIEKDRNQAYGHVDG